MVWAWIGVGLLLFLGAAAVIGWLLLRLWRQARVLGAEAERLSAELAAAASHLDADPGRTA